MKPFLLWVDPAWKTDRLRRSPLIFPFWGNGFTDKTPYQKAVFDTYSFDTSLYNLALTPDDADMVFVPYLYSSVSAHAPEILRSAADLAHRIGKPLLIDDIGDVENTVPFEHAVIIRFGGYRFLKKPNEVHVPLCVDDLLVSACNGNMTWRSWQTTPSISFSGWADVSAFVAIKTMVKEYRTRLHSLIDSRYGAHKRGVFFRREAVRVLEKSERISTNFLVRTSYSGHRATASKEPDVLRREFVNNLIGSDYALDIRGDANASQRLFEILSLGRIPVILDTERNFPFDDEIDYGAFSLRVDFRDLRALPDIIADFHASLTPEKFEAMQRAARDAFVHHFSVPAMTKHIVERLRRHVR
jgi:hypothetical protein